MTDDRPMRDDAEATKRSFVALFGGVAAVTAVIAAAVVAFIVVPPWLEADEVEARVGEALPAWEAAVAAYGRCLVTEGEDPQAPLAYVNIFVQTDDVNAHALSCRRRLREAVRREVIPHGAHPVPLREEARAFVDHVHRRILSSNPLSGYSYRDGAEALCTDVRQLEQELRRVRIFVDGLVPKGRMKVEKCEVTLGPAPTLREPPVDLALSEVRRWSPFDVRLGEGQLLARIYQPQGSVFARTKTGERWTALRTPANVDMRWAWDLSGEAMWAFGKRAGQAAPVSFSTDGEGWTTSLVLGEGLVPYAAKMGRGDSPWTLVTQRQDRTLSVRRSDDGGQSFDEAAVLMKPGPTWRPRVHIANNGEVVALAIDGETAPRFVAAWLGEEGEAEVSAVELTSGEASRTYHPPQGCVDADDVRHWALVQGQHLVTSGDGGRSWELAHEFGGGKPERAWLFCGGGRAAVIQHVAGDNKRMTWSSCTTDRCGAPQTLSKKVVHRLDAVLHEGGAEVLMATTRHVVHLKADGEATPHVAGLMETLPEGWAEVAVPFGGRFFIWERVNPYGIY